MTRRRLAPLALVVVLPGCFYIEDDPPPDTSKVITSDTCAEGDSTVTAAIIDGDRLTFTAQYGGCGAAEVWACWNGVVYQTLPAQVDVFVQHADAGPCEALLETTRTVDLTPVIDGYVSVEGDRSAFGVNVGALRLTWEP